MTPLATLSNCSNPYAHEDSTPSGIPALADELLRIPLPRTPANREDNSWSVVLSGVL
jgi:hypothetical protein